MLVSLVAGGSAAAAQIVPAHHVRAHHVAESSAPAPRPPGAVLARIAAAHRANPSWTVSLPYPQLVTSSLAGEAINARLRSDAFGAESGFFQELARFGPLAPGAPHFASSLFGGVQTTIDTSRYVGFLSAAGIMPAGAAHPTTTVSTRTFDLRTGAALSLAELFRPKSDYLAVLSQQSRRLLRPVLGSYLDPTMFDPGTAPVAANFTAWSLTPFGLRITFQNYQVAAYAVGTPSIVIPYGALGGVAAANGPMAKAAASGPVHMQLLPARSVSAVALCDVPLSQSTTAVPTPLRCANGAINVEAWNSFAEGAAHVLSLTPQATVAQVKRASCLDLGNFVSAAPYVRAAVGLASAYNHWHFATSPLAGFPADCTAKRAAH